MITRAYGRLEFVGSEFVRLPYPCSGETILHSAERRSDGSKKSTQSPPTSMPVLGRDLFKPSSKTQAWQMACEDR